MYKISRLRYLHFNSITSCKNSLNWLHNLQSRHRSLLSQQKMNTEMLRTLYDPIEPYSTGKLQVSKLHSIYYELVGNPKAPQTAVVLHGGLFVVFSMIYIGKRPWWWNRTIL